MEIDMIVDLQFGSTGKGLLAGYLAMRNEPDTIVTAWGPNAGHTFIDDGGRKFVNIALPNGLVARPGKILLGPGSLIDPIRLEREITENRDYLRGTDILVHEHAALVLERHREAESRYGFSIGSTMKGVGEALIEKIRRGYSNVATDLSVDGVTVVNHREYQAVLRDSRKLQVEGCQGYSLGINAGFYPHCTSRDCTVAQLMVDCGIPFSWYADFYVHGVARTFPIRVANRFKDGVQVGTSGPCYPDQKEITWGSIGLEPELTTVTKLPRRLFTWSDLQVQEAIYMNNVDSVFLNFVNYLPLGIEDPEFLRMCGTIKRAGSFVQYAGTGPTVNHIMEI